jgi:hypothetical protein
MEIPDELVALHDAIAWELMALPGVTGVGVGFRIVNGQAVEEPALRVSVADISNVPKGIPETVGSFGVSIYEADFSLCGFTPDTTRYAQLAGGIKIASRASPGGTLGAIVKDVSGQGIFDVLALTCAHCVMRIGDLGVGQEVWQADAPQFVFPVSLVDFVGNVAGLVFPRDLDSNGRFTSNADAAVFALEGATVAGRTFSRRIVGNAGPTSSLVGGVSSTRPAKSGDRVVKRGFFTGLRSGQVHQTKTIVPWHYMGVTNRFLTDQMVIAQNSNPATMFADEGDSGSVVLIEGTDVAVGLVCYKFPGFAVASQITNVEAALRISLVR